MNKENVHHFATKEEAMKTINDFMISDIFSGAGQKVVIEEFLEGVEASILSITDGKTLIPFISGKDHKQIFDGDKGPNTGGMGVLAPNPFVKHAANASDIELYKHLLISSILHSVLSSHLIAFHYKE